jgi:arabinofuranan 3-O-arabinosyltransferase
MSDEIKRRPIRARFDREPQRPGDTSGRSRWLDVEDRIFTERHLRFYGSGVVVASVVAVLLWWGLYRGIWVVRPDGSLSRIDFCWIWVSGHFAASSDPSRIYDHAVFAAAQDLFYRPGECLFLHQYIYPPTFLFFTYPLSLMPYLAAFAVWVIATFLVYEKAVYAIVPTRAALIVAVVPGVVLKNLQLGHSGFLAAGLVGLSLVSMERRPWLAGVFLGLLSYKPQYGVLFPLALLASRSWRALGSAAVATLVFAVAAAIAFGPDTWPSFLDTLRDRNSGLSPDSQFELRLQSVFGLLHWAGASAAISWAAQSCVAVIAASAVWVAWVKPIPHGLKAAVLCVASVMFTPYVLGYDLCILSIAGAFLVGDGIKRGFLPGERTVMLLCVAGLYVVAVPIGPIIYAALLLLAARRFVAYRAPWSRGQLTAGLLASGDPGHV